MTHTLTLTLVGACAGVGWRSALLVAFGGQVAHEGNVVKSVFEILNSGFDKLGNFFVASGGWFLLWKHQFPARK